MNSDLSCVGLSIIVCTLTLIVFNFYSYVSSILLLSVLCQAVSYYPSTFKYISYSREYLEMIYHKNYTMCKEKYNNYHHLLAVIYSADNIWSLVKSLYTEYVLMYYYNVSKVIPLKYNKKYYEIDYFFNGIDYKVLIPLKAMYQPNIVNIIIDDAEDEQKLAQLKTYMGPNEHFCGADVSPSTFGFDSVEFVRYHPDDEKVIRTKYHKNDRIL